MLKLAALARGEVDVQQLTLLTKLACISNRIVWNPELGVEPPSSSPMSNIILRYIHFNVATRLISAFAAFNEYIFMSEQNL